MRRALLCLALSACHDDPAPDEDLDMSPVVSGCDLDAPASDAFADCVDAFAPVDATFGQDRFPQVVLGPPVAGAGPNASLDVLSLGCGGTITVGFAGEGVVDGPGPDLLVFENPLQAGSSVFVEPARVLVSADGEDWRAFPCDPTADEPRGCAGLAPVHAEADAQDPAAVGGDAFDLAEVGLERARFVRLIDVVREHYGDDTWCGGQGGGFDLDALAAVHAP